MIEYQVVTGRTRAQINFAGAEQIWRLLWTLDTPSAKRMHTKALIVVQERTMAMQREINHKLREENEKLNLALEFRNIGD